LGRRRMSGDRMKAKSTLTNIQEWLRNYSGSLEHSFTSSAGIKHSGEKGERREYQIFKTLKEILPTRMSVEQKTIIVDTEDIQSPMFDGVLVDRMLWPRNFIKDGNPLALIESVLAAIEIKSSLNQSELISIFENSRSLRSMKCFVSYAPLRLAPLVTAFTYECDNLNLSFFDFSTLFRDYLTCSPSLVCILNKGLFGFMDIEEKKAEPMYEPLRNSLPALYNSGKDALLLYIYFLSGLSGMDPTMLQTFTQYCDTFFSAIELFYFDEDFLNLVASDEAIKNTARSCFERKAYADIQDLYIKARKVIGLPT
jgi:hypothetical protein